MRHAAQRTMAMQDNLPADGSVYMVNMDNKIQSVMDALRAWEKKRGLSFSFKGRLIQNRPNKEEPAKEKAKVTPAGDRPITVPREPGKPGRRSTLTKEQRRKNKNESNKRARDRKKEHHAEKSRAWRASRTEAQREEIRIKHREWKRAKKAAANAANGGGTNGLPLANPGVSGEAR